MTRVEKPQGEKVFRHFSTEVGRTMKRSRFHIALEKPQFNRMDGMNLLGKPHRHPSSSINEIFLSVQPFT